VEDGARDLPMASWSCDYVKKEFPESRIRQEGGRSDINDVPMSSDWTGKKTSFHGAEAFPEGAPRVRPFYWDIAKAFHDEEHRKWGKNPRKVVQKLMQKSAVPYWLPPQDAQHMGSSSEMWFHPPGAGALAHMDPHCSTTVSFCFSGARRWRMMVPPEHPHPEGYFDGQVYGTHDASRRGEWQPTFSFDAPAGSGVVVYPGMVHETVSTGKECSSSISQTFAVPVAAAYYRAFWPRFALIHEDVGQCSYMVEDMVVLGSRNRVPPTREGQKATKAAQKFAQGVDIDGDGVVSDDEITRQRNPHGNARREHRTIEELKSFHDVDADGLVTVKEVASSWVMYATAMARLQEQHASHGGEF